MTKARINAVTLGVTLASLAGLSTPTLRAADEAEVKYQSFTLSAGVGTLGIGADARWRFSDHFGIRGGLNYFEHSENGREIEGLNYDTELQLFNAPLSFDIYPWQNRTFRFSVGALINMNNLEGFIPAQSGVFIPIGNTGPIGVDSAALGDLSLKVEQQTFSPFISVAGDFHLNRAKTLSIGFEAGVAYTGNPDVTLLNGNRGIDPALDGQVDIERQQIEDRAEDFKFYPIVKVSFNIAF